MIITYKEPYKLLSDKIKEINQKCCFIGRLDPCASGISIFLTNQETKYQKKFLHLDKTYQFTLLLGLQTDTGDILGKILSYQNPSSLSLQRVFEVLQTFHNTNYYQKYQKFSSYPIKKNGIKKPLWYWAKNNGITDEETPKHNIKIYKLDWEENIKKISVLSFVKYIEQIQTLKGDFRCDEILKHYHSMTNEFVFGIKCYAKVSSGTYIRQLCLDIGEKLGFPCCAFEIERLSFHMNQDLIKELNLKIEFL